ncbi:hypothetical protein SAMN05192568_102718 [Methylobacterium pseudosasicola]|uniref:Uncharacterized protein n=1 Tax=Methylobacterium pseudosasicola TaxID=582667 RepID=A0A1I4PXQ4_9HYPH|nr:hypothetical protein SAMN05192568_102718 [Methylobacterium pseudosasicola]
MTEALAERVKHLEMRLAIQEDIVAACLERGAARTVQSLGAVVEYLASRGLIDEEELKAFIEGDHRTADHPAADGSIRSVPDIHQWLSWRKSGRAEGREARRGFGRPYPCPGRSSKPSAPLAPGDRMLRRILGALLDPDLEVGSWGQRDVDVYVREEHVALPRRQPG